MSRQIGQTTRLIDLYIQKLFTQGKVELIDHYPTTKASEALANTFLKRLEREHPNTKYKKTISHNTIQITLQQ